MMEYISTKNTVRPLSIAVFGIIRFRKIGIVEVANSIASNLIKNKNLSQFSSPLDLVNSFHKVRDIVLDGKIPLVFDEFDSALEGNLGWLKYFEGLCKMVHLEKEILFIL